MNCLFCNIETEEKIEKDNIVIIAHSECLKDRKKQLRTRDYVKCLLYENELRRLG
ncbi:hypothetical protein J2736_006714 [Paenibacillus qinlingensis]|uniref:Uncharacterized protein n=1 Tax=Paenibacillus qinlingensis TaxID=1837343 RepID=A0ABU1P8D0_9BACL|nr:hypothetical protein [Paenibacillus qinlingensis]